MSNPVTYSAVLPVAEETVLFVARLLAAERRRRGTRSRRRVLGCYRQAVLVLRWFLDGTRLAQLATDHRIGRSTAYRELHEGIDALAAAAPGLRGALLAARAAGCTPRARRRHADPHRPLLRAGPHRPPRPGGRAGGSVVVGQARLPRRQRADRDRSRRRADLDLGRAARPGARHHLPARRPGGAAAAGRVDRGGPRRPRRPGLRGEQATLTIPIKRTADRPLTADQRTVNALHAATRALAERGNSLLKSTFKALRRVSLCPWRIGAITAAALVLLHHEHGRTT